MWVRRYTLHSWPSLLFANSFSNILLSLSDVVASTHQFIFILSVNSFVLKNHAQDITSIFVQLLIAFFKLRSVYTTNISYIHKIRTIAVFLHNLECNHPSLLYDKIQKSTYI